MNNYVIVNADRIQKRIEELKNYQPNSPESSLSTSIEKNILKELLSNSIPLIPEIEKAMIYGSNFPSFEDDTLKELSKRWNKHVLRYTDNLKLEI